MKKALIILISIFIVFSCAVTAPSWTNIGSDGVYIENCRDTISYNQIDSVIKSNNIKYDLERWSKISLYNGNVGNNDVMTQWTITTGTELSDTIYVITKFSDMDSLYIFTKKSKQNKLDK